MRTHLLTLPVLFLSSLSLLGACADHGAVRHPHHHEHAHPAAIADASSAADPVAAQLAEVAAVHGAAGPWAVAGYRMGRYALQKLGLERQSFDLEIVHHSPPSPMYACVADGAAAATGASLGKLNLSRVDADVQHIETTYRRRSSGQSLTLKPSPSFVARFSNVPRAELLAAGRAVLSLPDPDVFVEAP